MNKVAIISAENSAYELEKRINSFIADKEVINVSLSESIHGYSTYYSAIILYRE